MANEQNLGVAAVANHIFAAARQESGRMARVIWLVGFAAPLGFASLAGRTKWPILGWAANLLPWWGWLIVASYVALAFLLISVAARGASLEAAQRPRLKVEFDKCDPLCFHETFLGKDREDKVAYVAVLPRALSQTPVRGCVGYLNAVLQLGDDGQWHQTTFVNRVKLEWGMSGWGPVDIDDRTNQALNVFFVKKRDPRIHPTILGMPNKDKDIFHVRDDKVRRFDIVILDDRGVSGDISLSVQLGEDWNDIHVKPL